MQYFNFEIRPIRTYYYSRSSIVVCLVSIVFGRVLVIYFEIE